MNLNNLYFLLPAFIQNILISLYGFKIKLTRHAGNYANYKDEFKENLKLNKDELEKYQLRMLRKSIENAVNNVPYYSDLFNVNNIKADDIKSVKDLCKIPILDKAPLKSNPEKFINKTFNKNSLFTVSTSGTTGTPLSIYCNSDVRQKNYAFFDRFLDQVGIKHNGKRATFGGRVVCKSTQKKPPFGRYSFFQKNLLMSTYHLSENNIPSYINKLRDFKPDYIDAYPSALYVLSKYAFDNNISLKGVTNAITTSAEALTSEHRRIIEDVFDVPIYDQYGSSEMCVFIAQCNHGKYHLHSDYSYVEFIKENGEVAKAGEEAELICTGFINPVMPLIRYRIGDLAVYSDEKCECGSNFPVIQELLGRKDDFIVTPDGRKISRLGRVFYDFPVKEVQYIQRKLNALEIYIIKDENYTNDHEKKAILELQKRLGTEIALEFIYVSSIERSLHGKFKTIISKLNTQ
jgi:phenylacetate-CoA ligase